MAAKNPDVSDTTTAPGYVIAKFTTVGTGDYTIPAGVTKVDYLVVAGGGAGYSSSAAGNYADGGHAGGYSAGTDFSVTPGGTVTVTVGTYGLASGGSGDNSVFSTVTSTGGIGGTHRSNDMNAVYGGDGSSHIGYSGANPNGGNGGAGNSNSITGSAVDYCSGGGAGGYYHGHAGGDSGGQGGNADGSGNTGSNAGGYGGGGGGGAGAGTYAGGNGGYGVVIIKYLIPVDAGCGVSFGSACCMCVGC